MLEDLLYFKIKKVLKYWKKEGVTSAATLMRGLARMRSFVFDGKHDTGAYHYRETNPGSLRLDCKCFIISSLINELLLALMLLPHYSPYRTITMSVP